MDFSADLYPTISHHNAGHILHHLRSIITVLSFIVSVHAIQLKLTLPHLGETRLSQLATLKQPHSAQTPQL